MNQSIATRSAIALLGTLLLGSAHAIDPELPEILVSAPEVKALGRNAGLSPIERVIIKAHVPFDPATLTSDEGVKKLRERVREGARRACGAAEPGEIDDLDSCVLAATRRAEPQVELAVAKARTTK